MRRFLKAERCGLGNGALLTASEFLDTSAWRIRSSTTEELHKLSLKVQGLAFDLPFTDKKQTVNAGGESLARAEELIRSRNFFIASRSVQASKLGPCLINGEVARANQFSARASDSPPALTVCFLSVKGSRRQGLEPSG